MNEYSGKAFQFKAVIYEGELDRIAGWVEEYPTLETGGDLFGFWTHSGAPVVQFVLGPGPNSRRNQTSFYQDRNFLIQAGEVLQSKHGLQHIGEWHSHHQLGLMQPSSGDERTVFRALERYDFPRFLLCIANLRRSSDRRQSLRVKVSPFLFTKGSSHYQSGAWVVLPSQSPIRQTLEQNWFQRPFSPHRISKNWDVDKTTLDVQLTEPTQQIEISAERWYAKPTGLNLLRAIDTQLKQKLKNCHMLRTPSEQIYFTFEEHGATWRVEFPDDFPQSSPSIQTKNHEPYQLNRSNNRQFTDAQSLVNALLSYLQHFTKKGHSHGMEPHTTKKTTN